MTPVMLIAPALPAAAKEYPRHGVPHAKCAISIFDVDRTLTLWPTYSAFLLYASAKLSPWRLALIPALVPLALAYASKRISRKRMKQAMHAIALGARVSRDAIEDVADSFASLLDTHFVDLGARSLLAAEKSEGRVLALATAAPLLYIKPLARRLGIEHVVATPSQWCAGSLTPIIGGENCHGFKKRSMVEQWVAVQGFARDQIQVRFYSDHHSDLPTFEWADEAVAVNPSRRLRDIAQNRGWPVLDWRGRDSSRCA